MLQCFRVKDFGHTVGMKLEHTTAANTTITVDPRQDYTLGEAAALFNTGVNTLQHVTRHPTNPLQKSVVDGEPVIPGYSILAYVQMMAGETTDDGYQPLSIAS